jgi:hypothetical protein
MVAPRKIDPIKLNELISKGKKSVEIADFFNVSTSAVCQAKRKLSIEVAKASAEQKLSLTTSDNPYETTWLDGPVTPPAPVKQKPINSRHSSHTHAAPVIVKNANDAKAQLSLLIVRATEELEWIKNYVPQSANENYRAWQEVTIKHMAEIRKLISSMSDIEYKLNHVDNVQKALLIMYEEIGHESRECQKRIRDRLEKASILFHMDDQ